MLYYYSVLGGWLAYIVALFLLTVIVGTLIARFHEFFLGRPAPWQNYSFDEVGFYILMTVLVPAVGIYVVSKAGPGLDDDDPG
jgi:hypothetical protein